ncbi:flagellar hook-length control protein FliK [Alcanivorax marinus]|uniref:Flagellar hook-length control protein FliK n=1 Tax=Alloalcanivorax marinus TaxID=1177169 RepID=A0A9Q3YNQ7_9GAMM|nr:flagellar hook-length control protein FliK [Alloalcanivorax marinus]MCC4310037.1 flagellar hook-length control protein FliK [Alloalcanivorax marinus]
MDISALLNTRPATTGTVDPARGGTAAGPLQGDFQRALASAAGDTALPVDGLTLLGGAADGQPAPEAAARPAALIGEALLRAPLAPRATAGQAPATEDVARLNEDTRPDPVTPAGSEMPADPALTAPLAPAPAAPPSAPASGPVATTAAPVARAESRADTSRFTPAAPAPAQAADDAAAPLKAGTPAATAAAPFTLAVNPDDAGPLRAGSEAPMPTPTTAAAPAGATTGTGAGNAPASTTVTLQTPVASPGWGQELSQQVVSVARRGEQHMELHLNPRDLGPMSVSLKVDDQGAQAHFFSAHATVRGALEQALPQLREALAQQGIALGDAQVGDQPRQFAGGDANGQGQPGARGGAPALTGEPADDAATAPRAASAVVDRGGVDLYA